MISVKIIPVALLAKLPGKVFHFAARGEEYPYAVWAEENTNDVQLSDDGHGERAVTGSVRYYTKDEYDTKVDDIQAALDDAGISNALTQITYDETADTITYWWDWSIPCGSGKIY
jgi:hypothetical protein